MYSTCVDEVLRWDYYFTRGLGVGVGVGVGVCGCVCVCVCGGGGGGVIILSSPYTRLHRFFKEQHHQGYVVSSEWQLITLHRQWIVINCVIYICIKT